MSGHNNTFREVKGLNLPSIDKEILEFWEKEGIFNKSISNRADAKPYVFYEGPPSANGKPGIHHVMARAIKDIFCRYHTLLGKRVMRKGGWDTHGLPIELEVEKEHNITKKDIGTKISVEDYNTACRERVMTFKKEWDDLTIKMGYWLDLDNPYVTYENEYIESVWYLLKQLYDKGLMYKGYTIQPFSPAAGTGLSSHELNQPGSYRDVKDTSATAMFKIDPSHISSEWSEGGEVFFLAWTTTPWTLPSNTALAVGAKVDYVKVNTYNPYTKNKISVILAKDLIPKYLKEEGKELPLESLDEATKIFPWRVDGEYKGSDFTDWRYEQLLPYAQPEEGDAFKVLMGDFVTTEDGTGIVHIAPSFGADDKRVADQNGIGALTLVDQEGKFIDTAGEFAGRFVKNYKNEEDYVSVDIDISVKLKLENRAFKVEKYEHSYPHCWRTDKPIIYYPLDSWFISSTKVKDRMAALNHEINWKPASTGTGRFQNWLENILDWNLSRSRFWGTPLPIWRTEDGEEEKCIGSIAELHAEVEKAMEAGFMDAALGEDFDLHKPYVDRIYLVSESGKKMTREADLIDVWFDSGAMPYAQWHYPFENADLFQDNFPADFIAEGVDQTRGWFYSLHAISTMYKDSVSYKNVISNGLVLDKNGVKMSKRLGNAVNPFETIDKYGADATRWYMISNANPWDNLKFDINGLAETQRKFFGTLLNTYSFFGLYANVDGFSYEEAEVNINERAELDQWILSLLNSLIKDVNASYADYEPTKACRAISSFVGDHMSNWYVRLSRRKFWKGEYDQDKISAYQTLYTCLEVISQLMSPVAPFFSDFLFRSLNMRTGRNKNESVHLTDFPAVNDALINKDLEERMKKAQDISSMALALRKKSKIKVRQPLQKILIPILDSSEQTQIEKVSDLIKSELNIKEIEFVQDASGILVKSIKPNFSVLGRKLGPKMKAVSGIINGWSESEIAQMESDGFIDIDVDGDAVKILQEEIIIATEDIPGWLVNSVDGLTVALDVTVTESLENEGTARELVNRIQNVRKDKNLDITDRISLKILKVKELEGAVNDFKNYICAEILAEELEWAESLDERTEIEVNDVPVIIEIQKI